MNMTRYKLTGLLAALLLLAGCSQEEETLPNQRNSIVSFLTSTHAPQLISDEAVAESPDENPPFYTAKGNTVYRYISNYYDSGRASRAEVKSGSRVSITFRAYVFSMRNITDSDMPFFTNDPDLEQALYEAGLTPGVWKFEPMELTLGQSGIIKGLELALLGCRQGDEVECYMTYNMAYGDTNFATIPRESAVAIFFTVNGVD
ncbi:FKBP-type peptidyl-prolyl cis-trans isomerase [uncultured Alistipes sp.]|uniref:FKBP-type peptidyl-prolyl cis-trans isomerase n=2 Tax=uncultured Alistipes sp. TaxID=538949 RepID=UPI002615171A|nr:FKBP-type peptidyl-prolyl cis-trans isomerase [uncultured Alistipes sp.]